MSTEQKQTPSVFISYASPDIEFATWIHDGLKKAGIRARLDQVELRVGDNIVTWMNQAVGESDYVLLLLSPKSLQRYWVEVEWSSALATEAQLRRTFLIPCVLPGLTDELIPPLLRAKLYLDFRKDQEKAFLTLLHRVKQDELVRRDLGRLPTPASQMLEARVGTAVEGDDSIDLIVHSNRFSRVFRWRVPGQATSSYLIGALQDALKLTFSSRDEKMDVELSYVYELRHNGNAIPLATSLEDAGVRNGDRLELWIAVRLRDLREGRELATSLLLHRKPPFPALLSDPLDSGPRSFTSAQITAIAEQFFKHVDD